MKVLEIEVKADFVECSGDWIRGASVLAALSRIWYHNY